MLKNSLLGVALVGVLAACAMAPAPKPLNDGEIALPADYKSWPKFLNAPVQRPDAKQVREIYINDIGARATAASGFADGTVLVMENHAAQTNADGSLKTGTDGKLVKGDLLRVFVMGKGAGWGQAAPEALRNGNWVYASFLKDGNKGPEDLLSCRGCHLPLKSTDYVPRYDEHFAQQK